MNYSANCRRLLGSLLLTIGLVVNAYGAAKTFTGPGNFGDATKWNGGTLPVAGDDLTINGTCTVNNSVSTDNVAYGARGMEYWTTTLDYVSESTTPK
jgi:hypothetical protein